MKVIAPSQVLDEIREYLPEMAALYELAAEAVEGQFRLLAMRNMSDGSSKTHLQRPSRAWAGETPKT